MRAQTRTAVAVIAVALAGSALGAVSPEEAKQLGGPVLTEWGAERAGNKDGSIPAFTGERVKAPASYDPKQPSQTPDPFGDKPLYSINAQNAAQYADKLTVGQRETFKKYPNYRMDIYPTHRIVLMPKAAIENTLKNATSCKTANGGLRLEGCYGGVPFPIAKTGNEAVWNHELSFCSQSLTGIMQSLIVDANGKIVMQQVSQVDYEIPYWDMADTGVRPSSSNYYIIRFDGIAPARKVGEKAVLLYSLDPKNPGTRYYMYIPGQRRVKLAPDVAYDTPSPVSGGATTMDEAQVFAGAQDRFDFKLVGKRETYLLTNANKLTDAKVCPTEVTHMKNFINPDCARFELRRTWVVEATLKPGFRNTMPRRTMYFDEDRTGAATGETYDAAGKIYRVDYNPVTLLYTSDPQTQYTVARYGFTMDLQTGIVANSAYSGHPGGGLKLSAPKPKTFYSPEALAGEGIR